jgi:hypothetical protein
MTYCVEDANSPLLGETGTAVSPKNILGENFADWLQSSYPGARVISISLKDRSAIALAGHHPQAVLWFSHQTGNFTTSRYYRRSSPRLGPGIQWQAHGRFLCGPEMGAAPGE